MYGYDVKTMKDWINDNDRPLGALRVNLGYVRRANQLLHDLGGVRVVTFFLLTRYHIEPCRTMLNSAGKQIKLLQAVKIGLKEYGVTKEWQRTFERELQKIERRIDFVYTIIGENIRLTELYPYFSEVGFDRLRDFEYKFRNEHNDDEADILQAEIEEWNAAHQKEIAAHLESVAEEKANYERHKAKVKAKEKAEKKYERQARKAETAYIREMKKNKTKKDKADREIDNLIERQSRLA